MQSLHRRIAQSAFKRGLLTPDSLCDVMAELGRIEANGDRVGLNYWFRTDWLDRAQVAEVLGDLGVGLTLGASPEDSFTAQSLAQAERDLEFVVARTELQPAPPDERPFDRRDTMRDRDGVQSFDSATHTIVKEKDGQTDPSVGEPASRSAAQVDTQRFADDLDNEGSEAAADPQPAEVETNMAEITEAEDFQRNPTMKLRGEATGALSSPFGYAETVIRSGLSEASLSSRSPDGLEGSDDGNPRYVLGRELGRGGGGRVLRAFDRMLGRTVAMKVLHDVANVDEVAMKRFVAEAQATGQLEHPNIVPVYDFGVLPSGDVFYTMREVRRQSLREVLSLLTEGDSATDSEYNLVKLVSILRQVCQAVDYAHSRGVVHRDLKPDNVMLGDFGEVLVMDWGLARVLETGVRTNFVEEENGHTLGTPAYMSPEQAQGKLDEVDDLSDIYSLGAMLYEILTLQPPFLGDSAIETMWNVVEGELERPRDRAPNGRTVPTELERICQRAMTRDREARFRTARELHNALEDWLEGVQGFEASQKVEEGEHAARLFAELERVVVQLESEVRAKSATIEAWEPVDAKRGLWKIEDQLEQARVSSARAFGDSVAQFTKALAYQGDNGRARAGLAMLYWERLQKARRDRDVANEIYFEALVRQYDEGKFIEQLDGAARIAVETQPAGARVDCFRFDETDRRLVAAADYALGTTPTEEHEIDPGSYLLVVQHPASIPFRLPVVLERGGSTRVDVELPAEEQSQPGFVYIPGGAAIIGGDPFAFDARPEEQVHVDSFFCAQFPVTFRQYLEFLNEIHREEPKLARKRAPQTRGSDGFLVRLDRNEGLWVPDEILIEGPARKRYPVGEAHEYDIPVVGLRAEDAEAYCAWRSARDGRDYRLPHEVELEKAGRGVDGRIFPWGNRFDATFCKMRFSRPDLPQLEPTGAFVDDTSPYGVRDLGGGVQEWCAEEEPNAIDRIVKGGAWNQDARPSRMASRIRILAGARAAGVGFRLVYSA